MNKRHLHHLWTAVRPIRPRYFLLLLIVSVTVSVVALRHNNQTMIKLRSAVFVADQQNGDVAGALKTLQSYVVSHMNTDLASGPNAVYPPIQLKYTYDRLENAELAQFSGPNSDLYNTAQTYCQQQDPTDFYGYYRVPCIEQYVQSHGAQVTPITPIPTSLYEFSFLSPQWSPDLAGWSLVASALFLLLSVISFVADRWFKTQLH